MGLIDRRECCAKAALFDNYLAAIEGLRADNRRLRAALNEIAEHSDIMSDWPHCTEAMQQIARAALAADGNG